MHWVRPWRWILGAVGLFVVSRVYFVQELLTLLLFFSFAFAMLLSLVLFALVFLALIDRGMDFLEPRLRTLVKQLQAAIFWSRVKRGGLPVPEEDWVPVQREAAKVASERLGWSNRT
jgi:hypothetical protein